jgi:DNA-binding NtrC family response regulator
MLDRPDRPVYVLDDEQTIVFCNKACRQWLGPAAGELPGRRCAYHSSPDVTGPDAVAAALCPPPGVFRGQPSAASVCRVDETGRAAFRRARFIPLGLAPDEVIGVVAILDAEDLPERPPSQAPSPPEAETGTESVRLRESLQRFRRQTVALFGIDRLVGNSPAMRRARAQVELAAGSRASVLLVGPAGSGRQQMATAIHYGTAPEAAGTMVPLACSLLGPELIRSAVNAVAAMNRPGEQAAAGTFLFLQADQVAVEIQEDLAAMLSARPPQLRLIAAAEQPLGELVRRGRYREDLAAVLSTITIELPPLVQRREDLPLLAQVFLEEANARGGKQIAGFSPEALDRLDHYAWPGNIDELAQMVAESHRRAAGPEVLPEDLPERLRWAAEAASRPRRKDETIVLDEFLGRIERELIRRALSRSKGNKAKAARLLGLTRPRLYRRMVQLGLEEGQP